MVRSSGEPAKVYTVNGAAAGSGMSLPDWLVRKRAAKSKGRKREHIQGTIDLIQDFGFPEASIKIRVTRDGHNAIATGVYKPQMHVYDLDQMTLKFERHSDIENVDFQILSDDWTKLILLQANRSVEFHAQGGLHYSTRIPKSGRAVAYHYPSCDAIFGGTGHEVFRLNLDQGQFLNPLTLDAETVQGVNCIDINPAHQLLSFGTEGFSGQAPGVIQSWHIAPPMVSTCSPKPNTSILPQDPFSITSLASRSDGLTLAVGTSTGHTLLYDIRSPRAYAVKDQGYGLPVKCISWAEGLSNKMAGDGIVISADAKVIKLWDRNAPDSNLTSITPDNNVNHFVHVPSSGLLMAANEGSRMTSYYIPALGPAPKWCRFLDNITEEMEEQTARTVYDDFKFVDRRELAALSLDGLVGTPALKPYMHGYFISLKLYDTARAISNPFAYEEHRERVVKEKLDKLADSRIRSSGADLSNVKVNKILARKILRQQELEKQKKSTKTDSVTEEKIMEETEPANVLNDSRFKSLFEDPEFEIDKTSDAYLRLRRQAAPKASSTMEKAPRTKTAVEEEEEESDRSSSDGIGNYSESDEPKSEHDSSDEGDLTLTTIKPNPSQVAKDSQTMVHVPQRAVPLPQPKMVAAKPTTSATEADKIRNKNASFGERQQSVQVSSTSDSFSTERVNIIKGGGMEFSFIPQRSGDGDSLFDDRPRPTTSPTQKNEKVKAKRGFDTFGAGMEKGRRQEEPELEGEDRSGRTKRRQNIRSGSKKALKHL
ncbi:WD repeat-containing protein [Cantharellus anzutake]|uniref:WD repeat-containing protein n=1 Tax=Cantharellus anzutake TaxID=1750568 RepID=UPI00190678BF|nr:WD repeat-containing protein [Cantharellus anzutake]KAF8325776.1 WD repeat-containing protein [Cantharellus anzutake]